MFDLEYTVVRVGRVLSVKYEYCQEITLISTWKWMKIGMCERTKTDAVSSSGPNVNRRGRTKRRTFLGTGLDVRAPDRGLSAAIPRYARCLPLTGREHHRRPRRRRPPIGTTCETWLTAVVDELQVHSGRGLARIAERRRVSRQPAVAFAVAHVHHGLRRVADQARCEQTTTSLHVSAVPRRERESRRFLGNGFFGFCRGGVAPNGVFR